MSDPRETDAASTLARAEKAQERFELRRDPSDLDRAIKLHNQALEEVRGEDQAGRAAVLDRLISALSEVGRRAEALSAATEAVDIRRRLAEVNPAAYMPDLAMSLNELADLAVAVGQTDEARRLFTQSLTTAEALTTAEPGNTTYQRDLSVSYERMGTLADEAQDQTQAAKWLTKALARRRALNAQEPQRIDLAQELAVCLYLLARSDHNRLEDTERELIDLLGPFEISGTITARAAAILGWARE